MSFILFIIIIVLLAFFFFTSILLSFLGNVFSLFGLGRKRNSGAGNESSGQGRTQGWYKAKSRSGTKEKKILFDKDEGEYVDFEEIIKD